MGQESTISCTSLTVGYTVEAPVLKEVSLEIAAGEIVALIGPNGCGKTTLLLTLAGQLSPLGGVVNYDGKASTSYTAQQLARKRSLLHTRAQAAGQMTVLELLQLGRYPHTGWLGRPGEADRSKILEVATHFSLDSLLSSPLFQLSDGQRQRAALARAWVQDCPFMLLDEPSHHLDIAAKAEIFHLLKNFDGGMLIATHELELALKVANRVMLISGKGDFEVGSPAELIASGAIARAYENAFVTFDKLRGGFNFKL